MLNSRLPSIRLLYTRLIRRGHGRTKLALVCLLSPTLSGQLVIWMLMRFQNKKARSTKRRPEVT
jgi:hypothetical protein